MNNRTFHILHVKCDKSRHDTNCVTGGTTGCCYDNFWYQRWRQSSHHDTFRCSMYIHKQTYITWNAPWNSVSHLKLQFDVPVLCVLLRALVYPGRHLKDPDKARKLTQKSSDRTMSGLWKILRWPIKDRTSHMFNSIVTLSCSLDFNEWLMCSLCGESIYKVFTMLLLPRHHS